MVKATLRSAQTAAAPAAATPAPVSAPPTASNKPVDLVDVVEKEVSGEPAPASGPSAETSSAVIPAPTKAITVPRTSNVQGIDGDWGVEDLKFPQFKIVQGSGKLSQLFDNGTIIFNDDVLLPPPSVREGAKNPIIRFVPIAMVKYYQEKLSSDDVNEGVMPKTVNTVAELEEQGGTTVWPFGSERPENYWESAARILILLELPETSEHPGFALTFGEKSYAVGVYYTVGGSFRAVAKNIFNLAKSSLLVPVLGPDGLPQKDARGTIVKRPLLCKNFWEIQFTRQKKGDFFVWGPVVKLTKEETSPEIREYCAELLGTNSPAVAAE